MDELAIADRRSLRRKLSFWRFVVAGLLLLVALAIFAWSGAADDVGHNRQHVARVAITGLIQDDRELLERLQKIADNDSVKALVVTISSPGGTTYGGEVIYKAIRKVAAKKPVVSDVRTLAASAGYMIALGGDTIVAGGFDHRLHRRHLPVSAGQGVDGQARRLPGIDQVAAAEGGTFALPSGERRGEGHDPVDD